MLPLAPSQFSSTAATASFLPGSVVIETAEVSPTVQCPRCQDGLLSLITVNLAKERMFVCVGLPTSDMQQGNEQVS